eukprot:6825791-Pyramimonas_sp.AAC.1
MLRHFVRPAARVLRAQREGLQAVARWPRRALRPCLIWRMEDVGIPASAQDIERIARAAQCR